MTADDLRFLAGYECPAGRLCDCDHNPPDDWRPYACPHCGCHCPFPDPYSRSGDPDNCPCCNRYVP